MATFLQFKKNMDQLAVRVRDRADQITRGTAKVFLGHVAPETPYKTGEAISNWLVGSGRARSVTIPALAFQAGKGTNVNLTLAAGNARIDGYKYGTDIVIANNVPYIDALNSGSSAQHAGAFVEAGIQKSLLYASRQRLLDGN